ncbi:MAG: holo-ACP synthase [Sphingomonadaceae bacterium]
MRIVGFGSDLCNVERVAAVLDRHGERFTRRIFTEREIARAERRPLTRAGTYAKRFAAKEACAKALGTGFSRGVVFRDMGVFNLPSGAPALALTGGAAQRLHALLRPGERAEIHLTLTDDHPFALAVVLIVAMPAAGD